MGILTTMKLRRFLQHAVILFFIAFQVSGFMLTMFRVWMPFPRSLTLFSYGMMAPYQAYDRYNYDFVAEGLTVDGTWEPISLQPYFRVILGEAVVRKFKLIFTHPDREHARANALLISSKLLQLERGRGHSIKAIRLSWQQWPQSPQGMDTLRQSPHLESTLLATVYD